MVALEVTFEREHDGGEDGVTEQLVARQAFRRPARREELLCPFDELAAKNDPAMTAYCSAAGPVLPGQLCSMGHRFPLADPPRRKAAS